MRGEAEAGLGDFSLQVESGLAINGGCAAVSLNPIFARVNRKPAMGLYWWRRASIGSRRAARRAGK